MENYSSIEVATVIILSALMGGFIKEIASSLFKRWTTEYLKKEDFENYKKYVDNTFQKKDDHEEDFKKLFLDLEEVKKILVIIALKLNIDISKAHLTVSLEDIREALNNGKNKNENKN